MWKIKEVSELTGVSVRALHHYDAIGLLPPAAETEAGYRLYDEESLTRLQSILLLRELEFPLREIKRILDSPGFDRQSALTQQLELLRLKKERLERLIDLAKNQIETGEKDMSFAAFDKKKLEAYAEQARQRWGGTEAYREYERRVAAAPEAMEAAGGDLMAIFAEFGALRERDPAAPEVQAQVKKLRAFITEHYYTCTDQILAGLGQLYAAGGEMTEHIDAAGGAGTAEFAARAIEAYV